jgi:hypothetical protein
MKNGHQPECSHGRVPQPRISPWCGHAAARMNGGP